MRQGWKTLSLAVALSAGALALAPLATPRMEGALAAARATSATRAARSRNTLRQWTGTVTALDKTTLTVEKTGKKPQSKVFTKHPELRTAGDLEKDARVTVYYRDEDGHSVAHRVVVKAKGGDEPTDR